VVSAASEPHIDLHSWYICDDCPCGGDSASDAKRHALSFVYSLLKERDPFHITSGAGGCGNVRSLLAACPPELVAFSVLVLRAHALAFALCVSLCVSVCLSCLFLSVPLHLSISPSPPLHLPLLSLWCTTRSAQLPGDTPSKLAVYP
jgi:hypothetical protein